MTARYWEESLPAALDRIEELREVANAQEKRIAELTLLLGQKEEERATLFQETVNLRNKLLRIQRIASERET